MFLYYTMYRILSSLIQFELNKTKKNSTKWLVTNIFVNMDLKKNKGRLILKLKLVLWSSIINNPFGRQEGANVQTVESI